MNFYASDLIREWMVPVSLSTKVQQDRAHRAAGGTAAAKGLLARLDRNGKVVRPPARRTVQRRQSDSP